MEEVPRHDVLAGVEALVGQLGVLHEAFGRGWSLSDGEVREVVEGVQRAAAVFESVRLGAVKLLDDRPTALGGAGRGRVAAEFLVAKLNLDPATARADVEAAHALAPDTGTLPEVGAALAAGEITRDHADVAVRAVARLPKRLLAAPAADGAEPVDGSCRADGPATHLQVVTGGWPSTATGSRSGTSRAWPRPCWTAWTRTAPIVSSTPRRCPAARSAWSPPPTAPAPYAPPPPPPTPPCCRPR